MFKLKFQLSNIIRLNKSLKVTNRIVGQLCSNLIFKLINHS